MPTVTLVECPRDAMQGIHEFIPTETKINYLNHLLGCGFNTLDFGSFVSPKAIPQLRDTAEVLDGLHEGSSTRLLAIVANERGALEAASFDRISFLGYPFSVSETFQQRNTNASIDESLKRVEAIQKTCIKHGKEPVIYLSMAFGNPYGDLWHPDLVTHWALRIHNEIGINCLALSDTIGSSQPESITDLFSTILREIPDATIGAHLHTTPDTWEEKVSSAYTAGCRRFDGAIKGFGGCPMAADSLTGNMPMEKMIDWFQQHHITTGIHNENLSEAVTQASALFAEFS
jgi:hydroxymethylglutaryl-CoA lyase